MRPCWYMVLHSIAHYISFFTKDRILKEWVRHWVNMDNIPPGAIVVFQRCVHLSLSRCLIIIWKLHSVGRKLSQTSLWLTSHFWYKQVGRRNLKSYLLVVIVTKDSDVELSCFLWSAPEQTVEKTFGTPVIWNAIEFITTSLQWIVLNWHSRYSNTRYSATWLYEFIIITVRWNGYLVDYENQILSDCQISNHVNSTRERSENHMHTRGLTGIGIPIIKIRRSQDCLIFIMGPLYM